MSYHFTMSPTTDASARNNSVGWKSVALPAEHGGWGFTLEPVILGLLVAPSAAGWEISMVALATFLARRPVKIMSTDLVRKRWLPRTSVAAWFSLFYGSLAVAGTVGAFVTAQAPFWQPVAVAAPFAGFALYADAHSRNHTLVAELVGSVAMGATVTAIALASGWGFLPGFGLWFVLVARGVATIALVRGLIRRVHGKPVGAGAIYAAQWGALAAMAVAAASDVVPWMSVGAIAAIGVLAYVSLVRPPVPARVVGWTQIAAGLGVVILTAVGVRLGW